MKCQQNLVSVGAIYASCSNIYAILEICSIVAQEFLQTGVP